MHKLLFIFSFIITSQAQSSVLELNFYGKTVKVFAESSKSPVFKKDAGHKDLHAFQIALKSNQWSSILEDLEIAADAMDLDDYGRFNLVKGFVLKHAIGSIYTKKALVYVGLRMQGLDAMMAANASFLEIYISMKQVTDYGYSFNKFGKTYYSTNPAGFHPGSIRILKDTFYSNEGRKAFEIDLKRLPKIGVKIKRRNIDFYKKGRRYKSDMKYNEHYVDYLNDMPILLLSGHLLESAIENHLFATLDDSVKVWTDGMDKQEKQNFLLHMVQYAFPYKADSDYRKHEKRNTVAQSLADDFIDCEDKAVMFLFLAKRYTKTEGIMLYNKGETHVNCALEMPNNAVGYTFKYKGKKYLIAEPAFQGYDLAETDFTIQNILDSKIITTE